MYLIPLPRFHGLPSCRGQRGRPAIVGSKKIHGFNQPGQRRRSVIVGSKKIYGFNRVRQKGRPAIVDPKKNSGFNQVIVNIS